jgi:hypothetical protein
MAIFCIDTLPRYWWANFSVGIIQSPIFNNPEKFITYSKGTALSSLWRAEGAFW